MTQKCVLLKIERNFENLEKIFLKTSGNPVNNLQKNIVIN